jgi:hypothetical protein
LTQIDTKLAQDPSKVELPENVDNYDKFKKKALKLKDALELELDERKQVDNVINFFVGGSSMIKEDLLDDD